MSLACERRRRPIRTARSIPAPTRLSTSPASIVERGSIRSGIGPRGCRRLVEIEAWAPQTPGQCRVTAVDKAFVTPPALSLRYLRAILGLSLRYLRAKILRRPR